MPKTSRLTIAVRDNSGNPRDACIPVTTAMITVIAVVINKSVIVLRFHFLNLD